MNGRVRQRSHLVPGLGARVRYSLGTNVNTRYFQLPTVESGTVAVRSQVQGRALLPGHNSGHWVPVCIQVLLVLGSSTAVYSLLSLACFKMAILRTSHIKV